MTCTNKTIKELSSRQIAFNLDNNQSYFSKVQYILNIYDLPNLQCLSEGLTSKEIWKLQVKRAINKHWSELLQKEALEKSTLKYMNIDSVEIGRTHSVWSSLESTVSDVRKGITKSRMITGTYMLQSNVYKFSNATESSICKCCATDSEDIVHMLLDCPALFAQRKQYFGDLRSLIVNCVGIKQWESTFNTKENIVRLILDCSSFACLKGRKEFLSIVKATTEMCHRLHITRLHKLNP